VFKVTERLYLDASRTRVLREGDPEASYLLAPKGGEIPEAEARRLGLLDGGLAVEGKELEPDTKVIWPAETKRGGRRRKA
jgi:hypothetical protein